MLRKRGKGLHAREPKERFRILALISGALALIALTLLVGVLLQPKTQYQRDMESLEKHLSGMTEEEIRQALDDAVAAGSFRVSINPVITVDEDGWGNVRIENSQDNLFGMRVDIVVTDAEGTAVTVYSSKTIAPGYSLEYGSFTYLPPPGAGDALAIIHAVDLNTGKELGSVDVAVILERLGADN